MSKERTERGRSRTMAGEKPGWLAPPLEGGVELRRKPDDCKARHAGRLTITIKYAFRSQWALGWSLATVRLALVQRFVVLVLIAWLPGCGPLRAMLAPESVLAGGANQVGSSVARAVDGVATQQTIADVDRIIATRGEAENIDELRRLKSDLEANPLTTNTAAKTKPRREAPPREFDRRYKPPDPNAEPVRFSGRPQFSIAGSAASRRGHQLVANPTVGRTHRGQGEPFATSRGHLLPPAEKKIYDLDFRNVRAQQPPATEPRR